MQIKLVILAICASLIVIGSAVPTFLPGLSLQQRNAILNATRKGLPKPG